jgi:S-DNA-T family DNA segregation ATPase FtsK/SpoIIIE
MATAKKKSKKAGKPAPKHLMPEGFWRQIGAIVLIVLAILLIVAFFNVAGPVPAGILNFLQMTIGWTTYVLPVVLAYIGIQIFRADKNRLPSIMVIATIVFVILSSGFLGLFAPDSLQMTQSQGGFVGYTVDAATLAFLSNPIGKLLLGVLIVIDILFVLRVTPAAIIRWFKETFASEQTTNDMNVAVAKKAAAISAAKTDEGLGDMKIKNGLETPDETHDSGPVKKPVFGLRNSTERDKKAEEKAPLISRNDTNWKSPSLELLEKKQNPADAGDVKHNAQIIKDTLGEFGIEVDMEGANIGPKVTQYTLKPPSGVKLARITQLETNIALNLAAQTLRIEAPIPGQAAVGIEVPNRKAADVRLFGILNDKTWSTNTQPLGFAIGKDISGEAVVGDLNKMPHLLIAGQTGSGKSVMVNTLLTSLLYRNAPSNMRLILIDPKKVEMAPYDDIPHLLTPVITEPEKAISALKWAANEMERRYTVLAEEKMRDIGTYNARKGADEMPYIVIVIDELADLMMAAARDVESLIVRIAQKARAVGIHLVLATQRPSVNIITGLIKANVPARIAFTVVSNVDSRTILDQGGAEKLLGQGDMLFYTPAMPKPKRIQGAWVMDEEVIKVTDHLRMQAGPNYDDSVVAQPVQLNGKGGVVMDFDTNENDDTYKQAVQAVIAAGKASTSLLQRRLRIGYSKAARYMETMEEQGIIGPADGMRPRDVLVSSVDDMFSRSNAETDA